MIFSTKERRNTIPAQRQAGLWAYIGGICKNHEMNPLAVGGTDNHVHDLFHIPPTIALAKAIQVLKANSSRWMNEQGTEFSWQEGYGAFGVSASNLDRVARYIRNQEVHHRKFSFEHEFGALLRKHGVRCDPENSFG